MHFTNSLYGITNEVKVVMYRLAWDGACLRFPHQTTHNILSPFANTLAKFFYSVLSRDMGPKLLMISPLLGSFLISDTFPAHRCGNHPILLTFCVDTGQYVQEDVWHTFIKFLGKTIKPRRLIHGAVGEYIQYLFGCGRPFTEHSFSLRDRRTTGQEILLGIPMIQPTVSTEQIREELMMKRLTSPPFLGSPV